MNTSIKFFERICHWFVELFASFFLEKSRFLKNYDKMFPFGITTIQDAYIITASIAIN